jgi:hypothetical protein
MLLPRARQVNERLLRRLRETEERAYVEREVDVRLVRL